MAIKLTSTSKAALENGIKVCIYGPAGAGKTTLCATTGEPTVIISAEGGMLSLRDRDIPLIEVADMVDVREVHQWLRKSDEAKQFQWVCFDSISEIAERCLSDAKERAGKDPRKAYGELQDIMYDFIRQFRDLPRFSVLMTAKAERVKDDATGVTSYQPAMPGGRLSQALPYFFDEMLALRVERDANGALIRAIQTNLDGKWEAKDRSGALNLWEPPNIAHIAAKIKAGIKAPMPESTAVPTAAELGVHGIATDASTQGEQPDTNEPAE